MQRRSIGRVLGAALGVAGALGVGIGVGLALWIRHLNPEFELDLRELGILALDLSALYTALHAVGLGAVAGLALVAGYRPGPRLFVAVAVGFWVLLNGALRHISAVQVVSFTPHMTAIGLLDAVCVALAASLVTLGIARPQRGLAWRGLLIAALILVGLEGLHRWHERPLVRDLAQDLAPLLAATPARPPAPAAESFESARLVVLGFDGLSWEVLLPLLREQQLPGFRALLDDAAYANLKTHLFTKSPLIWETISTGHRPELHGIGHHAHFEVAGLEHRIRHLPWFRLGNSPMAVRRLLTYSGSFAPWQAVPADATDARSARFWEVAQRNGLRVGIYDWMNTTPASPVQPFVHGYGAVPPLNFPTDLEEHLPPLPPSPPVQKAGIEWVEGKLPYEEAAYRRFRSLALEHQPDLLLYYTHFGDAVNHVNWRDEAYGHHFFISGLRQRDFEPGPATRRVMGFFDEVVADVLAHLPPQATLVVVSDHGFDFRGYEHDNAPPGVFILRGPGLQTGPFRTASIYDVAPTLLNLLGLPVGEDMVGVPVELARPGGPLDRPVAFVPSHGPAMQTLRPGTPDPDDVQEHREYLRALGYVN